MIATYLRERIVVVILLSFNPTFVKEIFISKNNQYSLRNQDPIKLPKHRTTTFGEESISFLGGMLWHQLSVETKQLSELESV